LKTPRASSRLTAERMRRQARRDTAAELAIRTILHRQGLRYRVDMRVLPGMTRRADVVFRRERIALFVDGCFWHGCPQHRTYPKSNADWWARKIQGNIDRDRDTDQQLQAAGWTVIRVWEHESPEKAAAIVMEAVKRRRKTL
jgi:DNA mismatch endonuclease (patch repair protein)